MLVLFDWHLQSVIFAVVDRVDLWLLPSGLPQLKILHPSILLRKPLFVFEHKKMDSTLRLFQERKQHMAIVIDRQGHVVGLVTIENILEEIVGEIIDESDRLNPSIQQINKNEWLVKGSIEAEEISAKTGIQIKSSDYVDLDTFIFASLGREAKIGDEIRQGNYVIIMEDVQGKKVVRARIVRV